MSRFRPTIQRKVFLAVLTLAVCAVALALATMQWRLAQGFGRYAAEIELQALDGLVVDLAAEYGRGGNWNALERDPGRWAHLLREIGRHGPGAIPPPLEAHHDLPPPPPTDSAGRPMPPPDALPTQGLALETRLALFDAQGRRIAGHGTESGDSVERAVAAGGMIVGRLHLQVPQTPVDAGAAAFLASQTQALWFAGGGALLLAWAAAWLLARHFLEPIDRLAKAARALAAGQRAVRIFDASADELGDLARDFNAMADTLDRIEDARRQWIADTSHELRTPLAVLHAEIEALQDGVHAADAASLALLHKQTRQLERLIDDLRQTVDAGRAEPALERRPLDPLALLQECAAQYRPRFAAARLSIDCAAVPDRGPKLDGDADRLRQVFANLLENSLRYTDAGGTLRLRAQIGRQALVLDFEDSPPAPPAAALPRLFDRFYRAETSRSRAHGGSGLGLAICKSIVAAHGGEIEAAQSPLGGLAIRIVLPLEETA